MAVELQDNENKPKELEQKKEEFLENKEIIEKEAKENENEEKKRKY